MEVVTREYGTAEEARQRIAESIDEFYRTSYPQVSTEAADAIRRSIEGVRGAWARNVFPEMKITWGTYADNIGHRNSPGCFRCHDGKHASNDGKVIRQDCALCHSSPVPAPAMPEDLAK